MKRLIKCNTEFTQLDIFNLDIKSIVFVDDAEAYRPKNNYVYDVYASHNTNYSALSREQLLQLDEKERSNIHDIDALRKLHFDELTIQQQRDITQANMDYTFRLTRSEFDAIIKKLNDSAGIYIVPRTKNDDFRQFIKNRGGKITGDDVLNIINNLNYSQGYKYSKLSYADQNWNALLLIFTYQGSYMFQPLKPNDEPVTVDSLDVYIKIDVDNETDEGYAAISFHQSDNIDD